MPEQSQQSKQSQPMRAPEKAPKIAPKKAPNKNQTQANTPTNLAGEAEPARPQGPSGPSGPQNPSDPMGSNPRKRRWWLISLAAVLAVAISVGGYFAYSHFLAPKLGADPRSANLHVTVRKNALVYDRKKSDFSIKEVNDQDVVVTKVKSIKKGNSN